MVSDLKGLEGGWMDGGREGDGWREGGREGWMVSRAGRADEAGKPPVPSPRPQQRLGPGDRFWV